MYIIRDIFQLRFGAWKDAKALLEEAYSKGILPDAKSARILTDFSEDSCRLIFEEGYYSLTEYEESVQQYRGNASWKKWNDKFKKYVSSSQREILKQVL